MTGENERVKARRALEALRNGVPNRDAVSVLGCGQTAVEEAFERQLAAAIDLLPQGEQAAGLLVSGGFGTGKSHLLEYLQHQALQAGFVCSKVVISKETPLYDAAKVFRAAVESAQVPGIRGQAVKELALRLKPGTSSFTELERWAMDPDNGISQLLAATLALHTRMRNDPDLEEKITNFWAGDPLPVSDVRQGLKQCGMATAYSIKSVPVKVLQHERFLFFSRLVLGAGFKGWVLLIDEVELVGRYSLLQRGKSYGELARWLGKVEGVAYPGLTAVAAITDDYDISVLDQKGDSDYVGAKLREKDTEEMLRLAAWAEAGMRVIKREAMPLDRPNDDTLRATYERVRDVHARAYEWDPPGAEGSASTRSRPMRTYIRRWINEWDLRRLYPEAEVETVEEELHPTYGEDATLEVASEESPDESGAADS